ncbi:MAG TPA: hypothetical protein VKV74_16680, partial [Bryobacteraceae bacterium]|nr:hypothetical protein [Bryobacteraceae bacterium]
LGAGAGGAGGVVAIRGGALGIGGKLRFHKKNLRFVFEEGKGEKRAGFGGMLVKGREFGNLQKGKCSA